MATPSQTLATAASCLSSCLPAGMAWYGLLAVLDAIGQGATVPSTAQELATAASCYSACISPGLLPYALIVAAQSVASGGGGSGGGLTCGVGAPVAAPASGCGGYINTSDGSLFLYYSGAWH